ncbi:DUF1707 SHOCT-like domain-containing protein [Nonomuraea rhizosphaerae]|uniref:DUF1707 SHOCT-like domain-containing protein n=1 Tax=Nonomuraea rhizosphaerae TaxID=2665663 RepID=UPI001C5EA05C|nr:DUF1707 domain-containing protein [Nonomuraea rhizosphaerae]
MTGATLEGRFGESEEPAMDPNDLRIGDAERDQTMADLREHFAQGRLDREELDQRLEQTMAARTARDLAKVTEDLPNQRPYAPPSPYGAHQGFDRDAWRSAMMAHREQMHAMRDQQREMRRRTGRHPGHRHGPGPFLPILFGLLIVGLIFGGFGIFKVLFVVWIVAMVFSMIHRHSHWRRH